MRQPTAGGGNGKWRSATTEVNRMQAVVQVRTPEEKAKLAEGVKALAASRFDALTQEIREIRWLVMNTIFSEFAARTAGAGQLLL